MKITEEMKKDLTGGLVYLSHPYGGDMKEAARAMAIAAKLNEEVPGIVLINPISNFSYMTYDEKDYMNALDKCLKLLYRCGTLILTGDWTNSRGCMAEYGFAKGNIVTSKIYELKDGELVKVKDDSKLNVDFPEDFEC